MACQGEINVLNEKINSAKSNYELTKNSISTNAESYYQSEKAQAEKRLAETLDKIEVSLEREVIKKQQEHFERINNLKQEYTSMREEATADFSLMLQEKREELAEIMSALEFFKGCVDSATEENKRAKLEAEAKNFYRITLSYEDIAEIAKIRSIEPYLRDKEVLNKVIWSSYYRKPLSDLCGRVIGKEKKTGIYKLTNLTNGMVYVGQANDLASRFVQHVKKGIGAENPGSNKLYQAMLECGAENFTFEVIELCEEEQLNDKEKYWIEFFNGIDFGYNMRIG